VKAPSRIEPRADVEATTVLLAWTYVTIWTAVILLASNQGFSAAQTGRWLSWMAALVFKVLPSAEFDIVHAMLRKTAHFVEYAVLGLLTHRAFLFSWRRRAAAVKLAATLLFALACAGLDETHQASLPQRTGSAWDVALDTCGATFGMLTYVLHSRVMGGRRDRSPFFVRGTVSS
jgi:VanZ family protein